MAENFQMRLLVACFFASLAIGLFAQPDTTSMSGHPRLFVTNGDDFTRIDKVVKGNPMLTTINAYINGIADSTLSTTPLRRELKGIRLLQVSVDCFTRIFHSCYSYRTTGKHEYATRAIQEMMAVARFSDWNPSHFLDVAELMCALAIGYDWLYHLMTDNERFTIRQALIEKGLKPSLDMKYSGHWLKMDSNWNQVCNAGSTLAALAIIETDPEYAQAIVPRAVATLDKPMACYAPDGAYREGPGYWCYGTAYNCLFLAAVEKFYGTDFGLLEKFPTFLKTVDYHLAMMTPSYEVFCYADQAFPAQVSIAPFYLYDKTGDSSYLYMLQRQLARIPLDLAHCRHQRTLPAALVFAGLSGRSLRHIQPPSWLHYVAGGRTPVAAFRSAWDDDHALYLGLKCGSPSEGHNHADEGSFYMEAQGVRWAVDLGGENYTAIEKEGLSLWKYHTESDRWKLLRTGLWGHNCLIMNGHNVNVEGRCVIDSWETDSTTVWARTNLSQLYQQDARSVWRKVSMNDNRHVVIEDFIVTGSKPVDLRWQMVTEADSMGVVNEREAILYAETKELRVNVSCKEPTKFRVWSAEPQHAYESRNPGRSIVGFITRLKANSEYSIITSLQPQW